MKIPASFTKIAGAFITGAPAAATAGREFQSSLPLFSTQRAAARRQHQEAEAQAAAEAETATSLARLQATLARVKSTATNAATQTQTPVNPMTSTPDSSAELASLRAQITALTAERDAARNHAAAAELRAARAAAAAPPAQTPPPAPATPASRLETGLGQMRAELQRLKDNPAVDSTGRPVIEAERALESRIRMAERGGAYAFHVLPVAPKTAAPASEKLASLRAQLAHCKAHPATDSTGKPSRELEKSLIGRITWLEKSEAAGTAGDVMGLVPAR